MEFTVRFKMRRGQPGLVAPQMEVGLKLLDYIREQVGVPDLDPGLVNGYITPHYVYSYHSVTLTEEQARRSGHLETANTVEVLVDGPRLRPFTYLDVETERRPEDGGIVRAWLKWKISDLALLEAWFAAGCPVTWTTEGEDNNG